MKRNIALKLAYDGSHFFGWQKTSLGPSIEEALQDCLEKILQESIFLQAASRTDRGVHADGQCINFNTAKNIGLRELQKSLNALLPSSIRVLSVHEMPLFFHPTLHAQKKQYHYQVSYDTVQLPKERMTFWHVPYFLDLEKMKAASSYFLGEQDFSSFCNSRKNINYQNKKRVIESLEIFNDTNNHLLFSIVGNNFLYKMVRNIVGTLIYVGRGKIDPETIPSILIKKSRIFAGITAPSHGLTLRKIYYPQEFNIC